MYDAQVQEEAFRVQSNLVTYMTNDHGGVLRAEH